MIIVIDGYSVTGKSTVASLLATKLTFGHLNSGLIFRFISYNLLLNGINLDNYRNKIDEIVEFTKQVDIDFDDMNELLVDLRKERVTLFGLQISKLPFVRERVSNILKDATLKRSVVIDGRDLGTVVFPNAEKKFFFVTEMNIRVQRLCKENEDFQETKRFIERRDKEEEERMISPLKQADDAILIDTSHLTIEEVVELLEEYLCDVG